MRYFDGIKARRLKIKEEAQKRNEFRRTMRFASDVKDRTADVYLSEE